MSLIQMIQYSSLQESHIIGQATHIGTVDPSQVTVFSMFKIMISSFLSSSSDNNIEGLSPKAARRQVATVLEEHEHSEQIVWPF